MKEQIKQLRVKIDGLSQLTKELKPFKSNVNSKNLPCLNSDEILNAVNHLLLAKAWLGKVLEELGEPTPYANDGNRKTVEDIEPTADKAIEVTDYPIAPDNWGEGPVTASHIEKVDWLRQEINTLHMETTSKLNQILFNMDFRTDSYATMSEYRTYIKQHLSEARFWLGFELGRVKESEK